MNASPISPALGGLLIALLSLPATAVWGYRPFVSANAAVGDPDAFEIEPGQVRQVIEFPANGALDITWYFSAFCFLSAFKLFEADELTKQPLHDLRDDNNCRE